MPIGLCVSCSVAEPEPPGAAIFMAAPEPAPEMIFWSVGAESRSRLFLAALAASFGKEKTKALFLYRTGTVPLCIKH